MALLHGKTTKVIFGEPSMYRHDLETQVTERLSMNHMNDVIGMMAYLENISSAVTIGVV